MGTGSANLRMTPTTTRARSTQEHGSSTMTALIRIRLRLLAWLTGLGVGSFFDQVNSILIPPTDGKSTEDQIKDVGGDLSKINPAYNDVDSMTAALENLGQDDPKYQVLPTTWIHPKGSGYAPMANAVIDNVLRSGAREASTPVVPTPPQGRTCTGTGVNKFLSRDGMNDKIGTFCADAAKQGSQDTKSASTVRKYNTGSRCEVILSANREEHYRDSRPERLTESISTYRLDIGSRVSLTSDQLRDKEIVRLSLCIRRRSDLTNRF